MESPISPIKEFPIFTDSFLSINIIFNFFCGEFHNHTFFNNTSTN